MQIGLVGAGNMGSAIARGWGRPILATDSGSGRAQALVDDLGGEALTFNAELAKRADLVLLAHKPAQLERVAADVAPHARRVVSVLGGPTLADLREAYPDALVTRVEPNTPVAQRAGVLVIAVDDGPVDDEAVELLGELGTIVRVPEAQMPAAGAISGVGPAYVALLAEAWVDAAVKRGMPAATAQQLVTETFAGTAALMREQDTLAIRRGVTSPGGSTARGLAALERGGVRAALLDAMDDVVGDR